MEVTQFSVDGCMCCCTGTKPPFRPGRQQRPGQTRSRNGRVSQASEEFRSTNAQIGVSTSARDWARRSRAQPCREMRKRRRRRTGQPNSRSVATAGAALARMSRTWRGTSRSGSSRSLRTSPRRTDTQTVMQYAVVITLLVIALSAIGLIKYAHTETRAQPRPSLAAALSVIRRSRLAAPGASVPCSCGGIVGPSGGVSPRYGPLLACTGCARIWTSDGRTIVLRRRTAGRRRR